MYTAFAELSGYIKALYIFAIRLSILLYSYQNMTSSTKISEHPAEYYKVLKDLKYEALIPHNNRLENLTLQK